MCSVSYWPKSISTTNIDYNTRQEIRLNERLRQLEERIKALEDKQK